jgi:hypothetical protein
MNDELTRKRLSGWTNVLIGNLLGADYPPAPTPWHIACFEQAGGASNGWLRVKDAERTIPHIPGRRNAWHVLQDESGYHNLPEGSVCWFCGEVI